MEGKNFTDREKQYVIDWMRAYCLGKKNAKFRDEILASMPSYIMDRKFRYIIAELVKEGHAYSSAAWGYFWMPLVNPTDADIDAALEALAERKSHSLSTLENIDKNEKKVEALRQGQETFAL